MDPVDLSEAFARFEELWTPRVVASVNDYDVKIAKVRGEFVWHRHDETDEFFLVLKGTLRIRQRDREVVLRQGECYVVPRAVEHCPVAEEETQILLLEPRGTVNTGDADEVRATRGEPV
jgi:mannose-6-phosphate isomerase-like protein (cupin superfamily)